MKRYPDSWSPASLAELCSQITDGTHHSPANGPNGTFKYITAKNIRPWGLDISDMSYVSNEVHAEIFSRCPPEFEDVLYIKDGVTTGLAVVNNLREPFSMLSSVALLKPRRNAIIPHFLKHWLNSPETFRLITAQMTGTAIRRVVLRQLRALEISVPPLPEQKRIVAKIEALQARSDAAKEALDAIPPLLEKFRQSVLTAAFRGDLTRKWREQHPDVEPASELLKRIRAERRRKWEETNPKKKYVEPEPVDASGLPELPKGWCWASMDEIAVLITKGASPGWQGFEYCDSGTIFVRSQNVGWGKLLLDEVAYVPATLNAYQPRSVITKDDVLLNIVGASIGRPAVADARIDGANTNQAVALIRLVSGGLSPWILVYWLLSPETQRQIHREKVDVARANYSLTDISNLKVPVPPLQEQASLLLLIGALFDTEMAARAGIVGGLRHLDSLNQSILAKAFRGELVPQDPNDEPASVLLERIKRERANGGDGGGEAKQGRRSRRANGD